MKLPGKSYQKGYCRILVVSLGAKGALLARQDLLEYIGPPVMPVVSAVGAGDSMVAGIICGCLKGFWPEKAIRYGVAAGTAATMTPGSELCRKAIPIKYLTG
jgi:6-phosphofructokinase 2